MTAPTLLQCLLWGNLVEVQPLVPQYAPQCYKYYSVLRCKAYNFVDYFSIWINLSPTPSEMLGPCHTRAQRNNLEDRNQNFFFWFKLIPLTAALFATSPLVFPKFLFLFRSDTFLKVFIMINMFITDYLVFMVARLAENLAPEGFLISFLPNTPTQEEKTSNIFGQSDSNFFWKRFMTYVRSLNFRIVIEETHSGFQ